MEIIDYLKRMGHAPFNYPTPEGYPDQASPWMGTLLWRWNFAVALSGEYYPRHAHGRGQIAAALRRG